MLVGLVGRADFGVLLVVHDRKVDRARKVILRVLALAARVDDERVLAFERVLAELGVAGLLAKCSGRRSWRIEDGYCVPVRPNGQPDGFRVGRSGEQT